MRQDFSQNKGYFSSFLLLSMMVTSVFRLQRIAPLHTENGTLDSLPKCLSYTGSGRV